MPPDKEVVVGRSSELDMVLVEDMVSRRHAKITVNGDQIFIQDLGSTNGTFVNGEKIKRSRLQEGDRILIGTSIIKLVVSDAPAQGQVPQPRLEEVAHARRSSSVRTMTGSIAEIPLPDLMQLFSASRKSGVLVVRTDSDIGKIFLDAGQVVYASLNNDEEIPATKALFRILSWRDGTFDMDPPESRSFPETLQMSTEGILMEAMRQIDELARLSSELPERDANVVPPRPVIPPLKELSEAELEIFQMAYNLGRFGSILDKSAASDLETTQILAKLLREGYLTVV